MQTLMLINSQNNTYMRLRALPNIRYDESRELGQYFFAHIFCSFLFNNVTFFMDLELLVGLETYIYLLFSQRPRIDSNKRFLPRQNTTTA